MFATVALSFSVALLPQSPEPQGPTPVAPFAAFDVPTGHVATSRDDAFAAVVSMATAHRIDARKRTVEALPEAGNVASVALGGSGTEYALGLRDGRIVHVAANGTRQEFRVAPKRSIVVGLTWQSGSLAWWTANSSGGVLDLATGRQRIEPQLEIALHMQWPAIEFTADGTHVCWRDRSDHQSAAEFVVVQDLATGAVVARLPVYSTMRNGPIVAGNQVVHAVRQGTTVWHLEAFDTTNGTTRRLDDKLRGGHFVDLAASPSGRFVVEGDHEEPGIGRYRLDTEEPLHQTFGEARGLLGCSSLRRGDAVVEAVLVRPEPNADELTGLCLDDGMPVRVPLPGIGSRRPERAGTLLSGSVLWTVLSTNRDRRLEFFALP